MSTPELKIRGLDRVAHDYKGGPCSLIIEVTDIEGGIYEAEIDMLKGYNAANLRDALCNVFLACDAEPCEVYIRSFKEKK